MNSTKILLVSRTHGGFGSTEAFLLELAQALRGDASMEAQICLRRTPLLELQPDLKQMLRSEDVILADRVYDRDLINAVRAADVVHLHDALPDVAILARLLRKPILLTMHRAKRTTAGRFTQRLAAERFYVSHYVRDAWGPSAKRGASKIVAPLLPGPNRIVLPNQRRGFLFFGRWVADKGIETLLDAYASADLNREEWPLVLMGDGPLRQLIEYAIQKRGIGGTRVLGFCDEGTKAQELTHAKWAVIPSVADEGYSMAALEARRAGVPCLVTRAGGLPESGGAEALLCERGDPRALAAILQEAAAMPEAVYAARADRTRRELLTELEPIDFYRAAYRRLARHEA